MGIWGRATNELHVHRQVGAPNVPAVPKLFEEMQSYQGEISAGRLRAMAGLTPMPKVLWCALPDGHSSM